MIKRSALLVAAAAAPSAAFNLAPTPLRLAGSRAVATSSRALPGKHAMQGSCCAWVVPPMCKAVSDVVTLKPARTTTPRVAASSISGARMVVY